MAKTHLSKLIQRVMAGEEIIIAKSGNPVARLLPFEQAPVQRVPGTAKGKIKTAADFSAPLPPLPDELLDTFEGNASDT